MAAVDRRSGPPAHLIRQDPPPAPAAYPIQRSRVIDIIEGRTEADAAAGEIRQRVNERSRTRPAHAGKAIRHAWGAPHPDEPVATVTGRPEHCIVSTEQAKSLRDIGRRDGWNIAADDDDRPAPGPSHDLLHPPTEIAAALAATGNPSQPTAI